MTRKKPKDDEIVKKIANLKFIPYKINSNQKNGVPNLKDKKKWKRGEIKKK
jgi:hypothetical protein